MSSGQQWFADEEDWQAQFIANPAFIQWALFSGTTDIDLILYGSSADGKRRMSQSDQFWRRHDLVRRYLREAV